MRTPHHTVRVGSQLRISAASPGSCGWDDGAEQGHVALEEGEAVAHL